jgi:hypothetical protein
MTDRTPAINELVLHLREIAQNLETKFADQTGSDGKDASTFSDDLCQTAERLLWEIDRRSQHLDASLFGDPAWCLLLDLYVHAIKGTRISVSSACVAARVPPTTALRWISTMVERSLLTKQPDPDDARRIYLELTETARGSVTAYLARVTGARLSTQQTANIRSFG